MQTRGSSWESSLGGFICAFFERSEKRDQREMFLAPVFVCQPIFAGQAALHVCLAQGGQGKAWCFGWDSAFPWPMWMDALCSPGWFPMGMDTHYAFFDPTLHLLVQRYKVLSWKEWKSQEINQAKFLCKTDMQACISSCFIAEVPIEVSWL